jgi:hypothetical protein
MRHQNFIFANRLLGRAGLSTDSGGCAIKCTGCASKRTVPTGWFKSKLWSELYEAAISNSDIVAGTLEIPGAGESQREPSSWL